MKGWCAEFVLLWFAMLGGLQAQEPFTVDARGPYRAGEWLALALDPQIAARAQEIEIYPAGENTALTSFRTSAAHSVAPLRFPLRLDTRGRYDVRIDGNVVQKLALEMQNSKTWPARTWLPKPDLMPPQTLWESGAWNAAYAPSATDPGIVEAARAAALHRHLPSEALALGPLPARWFLDTIQPGHLIAGGLAALAVAAMTLSRRRQAMVLVCAAVGATAFQLVAFDRVWPRPERLLVWNLWERDGGGGWALAVDEILQGDGEVAFSPDCVIEPLAGGEIAACRYQGGTWHAIYRGGVMRRWWPTPEAVSFRNRADPWSAFEVAGQGLAFRGWHAMGEVGASHAMAELRAPAAVLLQEPRSPKRAQIDALARAYVTAGERVFRTWKSRRARPLPPLLPNYWGWITAWRELVRSAAEEVSANDVPNDLMFQPTAWFVLQKAPHHPFAEHPTRAYLRVVFAEP